MKKNTHMLTQLGFMIAVMLIMVYTPLGYLKTPWGVEMTFIMIPVAIGSIVLGPNAGAFLGLIFGLTSFAQCFGSNVLGTILLQENFIGTFFICVCNRVLVGYIPGLLYRFLQNKFSNHKTTWINVCCLLVPILNTFLYILGNWLIFSDTWLNMSINSYGYTGKGGISLLVFMMGLVAINGIAESIASLIIGTPICKILTKTSNRGGNIV